MEAPHPAVPPATAFSIKAATATPETLMLLLVELTGIVLTTIAHVVRAIKRA